MTITITTTQIRTTVIAEAVEYARRECLFLLIYEYKDMFDHGVWAVLTEDDPPPKDSQLLCTITHEGQIESTIDELPSDIPDRLRSSGFGPESRKRFAP